MLLPDTRYYYDLLTSAGVDDNGGVHYLYSTGPTLLAAVRSGTSSMVRW